MAVRTAPTPANGGSGQGTSYANAIDSEIQALWKRVPQYLINVGGTANAITAQTDSADVTPLTAYARNQTFWFVPTSANTSSSCTLSIDGVGALSLRLADGSALPPGALQPSTAIMVVHDGSVFRIASPLVGVAAFWVNFVGTGTVTISDSFNLTSITDNGTGDYSINFSVTLAIANYAVNGIVRANGTTTANPPRTLEISSVNAPSATVLRVWSKSTTAVEDVTAVHASAHSKV